MAPPSGKRLERLVAAIQHAESTGALVTWNDVIDGRQFDVTVRFKFGLHTYLTVIECKDYTSKVAVEKIDALVTKARDVKANKAILVSTHGFQAGCFAVAERHDVQLLVLTETTATPVQELVARITPGLNIYDVSFQASGEPSAIGLEDWGGRLAYLMNNSILLSPSGNKTPNQIVYEWQLTFPAIDLTGENIVTLPLQPSTRLQLPHQVPVSVNSMQFSCSLIDIVVPKVPTFDSHIVAGISARVELRDDKGTIHHTTRLGDIPLGFDSSVEPGRFYELAHLFNRYYCEKIEGDLITWTLLESYQHGHLFQATFTQKQQYAKHYALITDAAIIDRLNGMLARLRGAK